MATPFKFDDGAAYEHYMGKWSQLVGERFLDWLRPKPGLRWLDVGCGNGAFTEQIIARCHPAAVDGIDPSAEQVAFARSRLALPDVRFITGDAQALPYPDAAHDMAVMPLVIFFLTDPDRGVAEMVRVVRPGGSVTAYGWDMANGGFPYASVQVGLEAIGRETPMPPSPRAAGIAELLARWQWAGLVDIDTQAITVKRTFADFEDFWQTALRAPRLAMAAAAMPTADLERLRSRVRSLLATEADERVTVSATANAIRGRKPG